MKTRISILISVLTVLCLFFLTAQATAAGPMGLNITPIPEGASELISSSVTSIQGEKESVSVVQDHNVMAIQCYLSNYNPLGFCLAQPSCKFTDDASCADLIFSIYVDQDPVPAKKLFYVFMFYNLVTHEVTTVNLGVNGAYMDPGYVYTYLISVWEFDKWPVPGTYAVNVYIHPLLGSLDVESINSNTWFIVTIY